ncbi:superfamily II DNA or RNA helicase [Rhodococcus ruber]|uniref:protein DpdJ n=1 Tax=Rhodococcus ruber TaxID=1830 RepID=UPI001AE24F48|nr:protein DpdJ [Rhodococcus ruber]MBP2210853.1 superfamily II DNA or RNA helicase [Rhodococcus ruber]
MTDDRWSGVGDLLSRLEDVELRLLSWGIVDGFLSRAEVENAIDAQLDIDAKRSHEDLPTADEYLRYLLDTGLLHRLPVSTPRYRTRLGETLRLLRTLRQLWPPKDPAVPGWWRSSSTLVADYRLRVAPRRYPRRSITPVEARNSLASTPEWSPVHADILARIVGNSLLASFQLNATTSILSALVDPGVSARIITAGTGSGKTLAFYLPALLDIAATADTRRTGPHTLALYPRNELLRDQAREALKTVDQLGPLNGPGSRPARIALLYGATPKDSTRLGGRWSSWKRQGQGWVCPYFTCPIDSCRGTLTWSEVDRAAHNERLTCSTCSYSTQPGTLALTRESMAANPPDILFSSTEMLSQQSTSDSLGKMLGWRGANGTRLVLLDEVHTYSGTHGAQVGLMLRRWRHANSRGGAPNPVMVGLSATLRDAGDFFAALTGTDRSNVEVIAPADGDMLPTSREYGIVLRGDPISGTSLLSTTIQTAMLLGRVLDTTPHHYGSVAFAFTDNLDVINRLYDNLRNAEGIKQRTGRPGDPVLADLRNPQAPHSGERYADGQSWDLPAHLHRMDRPLRIARTSSQDAGTDSSADIITATSSLEVGFNDPRVGAVIQHKAPRDLASFLQRRGRAGRRLEMRPITVVVLSDYGRDRIAYQTYEKLLDPEIDARVLPISNRYVIKMQATHSLIDWVGRKAHADVREVLTLPKSKDIHQGSGKVITELTNLLANPQRQQELAEHLRRSLMLTPAEVQAALWEEPRSLLLSVVPTALRRLESQWKTLPGDTDPGADPRTPLPEFMSAAMFSSLNSPDVDFDLPEELGEQQPPPPTPIAQALREAVPGKVSRRFGYARARARTWLPVPAPGEDLELNAIVARGHRLGRWTTTEGLSYEVVRPLAIQLGTPLEDVEDSSNAKPLWRSTFEFDRASLHQADMPTPSVWSDFVDTCAFALHLGGSPLKVRRMTIGSEGELLKANGTRTPVHVRYAHDGRPAALGFELDVDAMVVTGRLPDAHSEFLREFAASAQWRTLAFRRRVIEDERLDDIANVFQRERLAEIYLHAFTSLGLTDHRTTDIPATLAQGRWADDLAQFLAVAYRADESDADDPGRTLADLQSLAQDSTVRSVLDEHGQLLASADLHTDTTDLLDRVFLDTFANALLAATEETLPDAEETDLAVDVEFDASLRTYTIIVSETSIGGLGLIEALNRDYAEDPRRFWDAVSRACSPTDAEDVDHALQDVLDSLLDFTSPIAQAVAHFRGAAGTTQMDKALDDLLNAWTESDGPPGHLLVSTFAARFLRPGSTQMIDRLVADLTKSWTHHEARLGIEIDARTLVFHATQGDLGFGIAPLTSDSAFSLLWLRGPQARLRRLEHWHPYRDDVVVERLVLDGIVRDKSATVDVTQPGWLVEYTQSIETDGRVVLTAPYRHRDVLAECIRQAVVTAVEHHGLRVYGRVTGIHHRRGMVGAALSLAEELQ